MNEVFYAIEYLFRGLTWEVVTILGIVFALAVFAVYRLLKAKKAKIEDKLDEKIGD